jgi:membrane associated rhomboid family serine protease
VSVFRARRRGNLLGGFTFGGRVPPGLGVIFSVVGVCTLGTWVLRGTGSWFALVPPALLAEPWRAVAWSLVALGPLDLFLGGLALWWVVPAIAYRWGTAKLLGVYLGYTVGATLATALVYAAVPPARPLLVHLGWAPVLNAFVMMWALENLHNQFSFWGVIPMTGRTLVLLLLAGNVLYGLYAGGLMGLFAFTPHFADLGLAWVAARRRFPTSRWKAQWDDFWAERSFRRRAKHLKVVGKNGQSGPKQWLN